MSHSGSRVIGRYKGELDGPLLIIMAGMHGNEPAGVKALQQVFKMLESETSINPDFFYRGEIVGIIGNLKAYKLGKRYISKDINRCWEPEYVEYLKNSEKDHLKDEDLEIKEILEVIFEEIERINPPKIYFLDLHTTSSRGGIFSITTENIESVQIAHELHAPVIIGLLKGISGTTLHYFKEENIGIPTVSIAFEGGFHENPVSVDRCIAAVINLMRTIKTVNPGYVENKHDHILLEYSKNLPDVVKVIYKHHISDNETWQMQPGYINFQPVKKGEFLAQENGEKILCPMDGLILMPLYQNQGSDGFFITEEYVKSEVRLDNSKIINKT